MRLSHLLTATAALVTLAVAPAMAQDARPAATDTRLQAQIEANDLSPRQARSLQARVDRVIARTGGTQVAINQVVWDGGDTLVPLPGERRARELGSDGAPSDLSPPSLRRPGDCQYLQFCTYRLPSFKGIMTRMKSCVLHDARGIFRSYWNNQTPGTRARFYNSGVELIERSHPARIAVTPIDEMHSSAIWYIRPC
jgi:hypothetical protein